MDRLDDVLYEYVPLQSLWGEIDKLLDYGLVRLCDRTRDCTIYQDINSKSDVGMAAFLITSLSYLATTTFYTKFNLHKKVVLINNLTSPTNRQLEVFN
ncbi:hypothetical protein CHUAL_000572 [Chamberlinius hualienensis]